MTQDERWWAKYNEVKDFVEALSIILLVVADVKLLQPYSVAGVYALFAAMITTRGWLMHDAHVFNELSKIYTVLSFVMLAEAIVYTVGRG